ncbi:Mlo-related protein [Macleaya cordata]|uniref:MLO-like protein n=1 Tax=Macleaya cordata TaxID=56857 RepID=A0A200QI17_MACCD|nr:Mlo-related protein [Macleaya cordata]
MAGGDEGSRTLEQTPTWAVAVVCFALVVISIIIEYVIDLVGEWLIKKHKRALYESLLKIKAELMLLGFISLLLTVGQGPISEFCIPKSVADTWHPCKMEYNSTSGTVKTSNSPHGSSVEDSVHGRRHLTNSDSFTSFRRSLAGAYSDKCTPKGKVPLVSVSGIHQLHIFIFVLAVSHVLYCILTMALGRAKMRSWKSWEKETKSVEYEFSHDPERFRYARDTTFGRRHLSFWSRSRILLWTVCFFRQFFGSVPKVDYLTLRHGFIMAHLAPQSSIKFDFQKYIQRSLEDDFKVVVGISPMLWFFSLLFLLASTNGWYSYLWLPFIPLIIVLVVGTKLQLIITRMGLQIQDRGGEVVQGVPTVQPADDLFWFNRPRLILYLIHFVLFQNAFQLAFFAWTTYEFGLQSCYHKKTEDVVIRISMGVFVQILCSYVTLPLYALVTQMGSSMKPTIFNETVATALKKWHHTARKHIKQNRKSGITPTSSMPSTPTHGMSPVHLLRNNYRSSEANSPQLSPRFANYEGNDQWDSEGSPSPMHHKADGGSSHQFRRHDHIEDHQETKNQDTPATMTELTPPARGDQRQSSDQHEIRIGFPSTSNFSFGKRSIRELNE